MADKFTPERRSEIMSLIHGKNTNPEVIVFRYLRKEGVYFQKHYTGVVGNPDIALPRKKRAVFIDGEFWHGYDLEKRKEKLPMYWVQKIIRNVKRDRKYRKVLHAQGWQILRVWDGEVVRKRTRKKALQRIKDFLIRDSDKAVMG